MKAILDQEELKVSQLEEVEVLYKQPVFGIYERNGRVYTEIIPDCERKTLRAIITGRIDLESKKNTLTSYSNYSGLVDVGYDKHSRINHKKDEFSNRKGIHASGIEAFSPYTKRGLTKFNGVKKNFHLHLKECEARWNKSPKRLESELLRLLKYQSRAYLIPSINYATNYAYSYGLKPVA
jgi:hypothetical protein